MSFRMKSILNLVPATIFTMLCSLAWGQDATGRIIGIVSDPSGAVVPGAKVTITNTATDYNRVTTSGTDGSYQVLLVPVGSYKVTAEARGFRKAVTDAHSLDINESLRLDLKMEVGSAAETVEVVADASRVETVNATLRQAVTGTQIQNAPLKDRNVLDLALTAPGVIPNLSSTGGASTRGTFSVAGGRGDSVTFLLDGGVNNNLLSNTIVLNPNPEAIEEFVVLTSNYNAEYGRNAGGIVSEVSKSGTNVYHGSVYDYLRNNDLNANLFFNNANGLIRPILKRNQFGAAVGGPIDIPKVIHGRNRMFFFVAYQGQRQTGLSQTSKTTLFTPAELTGDFSHSNSSRTGPDANVAAFLQKFPFFQPNSALASQGIIDPSRINTVAKNYIKAGLIPTSPTGSLISQASAITNNDELTEKLDFLLTPSDRLSVSLGSSRQNALDPYANANVNGYSSNTFTHKYYGSVNYTKTITPTLLNDFRLIAQRNNSLQAVPAVTLPGPAELGIGITPDVSTGPSRLTFGSGLAVGFSPQGPSAIIDNTYTWSDTLTWIKGAHTFKTGLTYTPYQDNQIFDFHIDGSFTFVNGSAGQFSKNDFADFLLGLPDSLLQDPAAPSNIRTHNIGGFFQDEWKIRRNLTLTLGMRYEYSSPKLDLQGRTFSAILGKQSTVFPNAPKGLVFPGDAGVPRGSNFPDRNDWAPRFGFAWDPRGNGKLSIRGGFGVFYDILKGEDNFQFNGQAPFFGSFNPTFSPLTANPTAEVNYMTNPFAATGSVNPFPSKPPSPNVKFANGFGGSGVFFIDPNLRTPYIYQYNLSVQREIMRDTTLEVDYIGSDSHKLTGLTDTDAFILGTSSRIYNAQPGVSPSAFSWFDTFTNVANANYNALVVGLRRGYTDLGFLGKLALNLNYTHSKSIDNASGFRATTTAVPYYSRQQFRAVSDFDLPNYVNFSATWELPFEKAWSSGPRKLTSGWKLYPLVSYRSGQPLNVKSGISRSQTRPGPSGDGAPQLVQANINGIFTDYDPHLAQKTGTCPLSTCGRIGNYFFDPTVFSQPAVASVPFTYGSLGRNSFRGPTRTNFDMTIAKETYIYAERVRLDIIGSFFNIVNHAQFNNPTVSITSSTFGQISGTADPRIIQFTARLTF
jgi:outer membrane receptor protein involved in Fe transport